MGRAAQLYQDRYWNEGMFGTVEHIVQLAREAGMTSTELAIAWVLSNPAVTTPILGASRPEQLAQSVAASDKPIDGAIRTRLNALTAKYV
jgi:aryl-alcohol dehydrogenase-like predicted oxidoreductase